MKRWRFSGVSYGVGRGVGWVWEEGRWYYRLWFMVVFGGRLEFLRVSCVMMVVVFSITCKMCVSLLMRRLRI